MESYLKRIIKTIVFTGIMFTYIAYLIKTRNHIPSWGEVLTPKFWALAVIHLIPSYFIVWLFEDNNVLSASLTSRRVLFILIILLWGIIFGIICAICHFVFNYKLF